MRSKQRIGDKIVTTIEESAIIQFEDVLAGCSVEPDNDSRAPWDDCDGWEHYLDGTGWDGWKHHLDGTGQDIDAKECNSVIRHNCDYRGQMIVLDCEDDLPNAEYYHRAGASKQVAAELAADCKRRTIDQLVKWYNDGWEWYGAVCTFTTDCGTEFSDSCWGIDDYDYAKQMAKTEIVCEVIKGLEKAGYTVEGQPDWKADRRREYLSSRRSELKRRVNSFNVEGR